MYHFGKFISIWSWVRGQRCTVSPMLYCTVLHCNTSVVWWFVFRRWNTFFSLRVVKTILIFGNILRTFSYKRDIVKHSWSVSSKSRLCPESKFAPNDDNANLILIWPQSHFQYNWTWRCLYAKNTGVEVLKMRYQYTVIEFVCSSSNGISSPEKCVVDILSSNLFAAWVPFRTPVLQVLNLRYPGTVIQYVCSWSTGRKEINVKFEKKVRNYHLF